VLSVHQVVILAVNVNRNLVIGFHLSGQSFLAEVSQVVFTILGIFFEFSVHSSVIELNTGEVNPESDTFILEVGMLKASLSNEDGMFLVPAHGEERHLELESNFVSVINDDLTQDRVRVGVLLEFVEHFDLIINADTSVLTQLLDVTGEGSR
jgi:hypothetical protein